MCVPHRIDFVRYSWSAVMKNQFENEDPTFTKTGISVLSYFSMGSWSKWGDMTLLLAFFTVYALLVSAAHRLSVPLCTRPCAVHARCLDVVHTRMCGACTLF